MKAGVALVSTALTFYHFWVKPKVRRKKEMRNLVIKLQEAVNYPEALTTMEIPSNVPKQSFGTSKYCD
jgi:hypothetical protein